MLVATLMVLTERWSNSWHIKQPKSKVKKSSLFQVFMESYNSSIVIFEPVPSFFFALNKLWQTYLASGQGFRLDSVTVSFYLERRSPRHSESGCRKGIPLKKHPPDHRSYWKWLSALLCPSTLHWCFHCHFKFTAVDAGTTFVNYLLLICRLGGTSPCHFAGKSLNSVIKFNVSER